MRPTFRCVGSILVVGIICASASVAQRAGAGAFRRIDRFDGNITIRTTEGRRQTLHVMIRKWEVPGHQKAIRFPEEGPLVVHLHSGRVTTVIAGKEEHRGGGSFWVLPVGASMSIEVTSESALFETATVRQR